jgi:hypothetical protein
MSIDFQRRSVLVHCILGTFRLWQLPDCIQLNVFHTIELITNVKRIGYPSLSMIDNNEPTLNTASIDTSIWHMSLVANDADVFIAFSIYGTRTHSIYLTTLTNMKTSTNKSFEIIFDNQHGTIIDYCLTSTKSMLNGSCYLYVLFDSQRLLKVNMTSSLVNDQMIVVDDCLQEINDILARNEYRPLNHLLSYVTMFKQLFKTRGKPGDCSYYKRKNERIEQEEQRKQKKKHVPLQMSTVEPTLG